MNFLASGGPLSLLTCSHQIPKSEVISVLDIPLKSIQMACVKATSIESIAFTRENVENILG